MCPAHPVCLEVGVAAIRRPHAPGPVGRLGAAIRWLFTVTMRDTTATSVSVHETPAQHARYFGRDVTDQQLNDALAERNVRVEGIEERVLRVTVRRVVEIWSI